MYIQMYLNCLLTVSLPFPSILFAVPHGKYIDFLCNFAGTRNGLYQTFGLRLYLQGDGDEIFLLLVFMLDKVDKFGWIIGSECLEE